MELITTYICKKFDIGIHDNMFGGTLMSLIDDAAGSYASQLCDTPRMVTIKFDELVFKKPVKVGSILKIYGNVLKFGTSSGFFGEVDVKSPFSIRILFVKCNAKCSAR